MAAAQTVDEDRAPVRRSDLIALAAGLAAVAWVPVGLWPGASTPAWPSASLGIVAIALAWFPGAALPRGLGAFCGVVGLVFGIIQIAAKWALLGVSPG